MKSAPISMHERLLYTLWRFQSFDKQDLRTHQQERVNILQPGVHNTDTGPDFQHASVVIDQLTWHGHVEIHVKASDWYQHGHHKDPAYNNVILHVVWQNDQAIQQRDGTLLPTLVLQPRVSPALLVHYQQAVPPQATIPCTTQLPSVTDLVKQSMLEKALLQRLAHKNALVYQLLEGNTGGWEETTYQLLAYNMGCKANSLALFNLSNALPLKIIKQNATHVIHLEALLFGQAGLLPVHNPANNDYIEQLTTTYRYLAHKYKLQQTPKQQSPWKFFRLRPANFPTIRIAQLAQLLHQCPNLFDLLVHSPYQALSQHLAVTQSAYWKKHYQFDKPSRTTIPGIGTATIENILINTVVPLLVAYSKLKNKSAYLDKALALLQSLPAENNKIIRQWEQWGIKAKNAFESQALLELFHHFCLLKKCFSCNIGKTLLLNDIEINPEETNTVLQEQPL